ncbi:voltage-dependent chloride channel 1, chloroplastic-like [Wolffia australiana]
MPKPSSNSASAPTHLSTSFIGRNPKLSAKFLHKSRSSPLRPLLYRVVCSKEPDPSPLISYLRKIPDWADAIKERGMRRRRSLYNHDLWVEHRSSLRHVRHLLSSLSSRVILSLIPPVFSLTAVAATLATYNWAVTAGLLPEFFPVLRASPLPYQLTAPALALLLVFRTEASYSRFQEGRHTWIKVMAGTSELAGMVMSSGGCELSADADTRKALLSYIMAFPVALKCHVSFDSDIAADLQNLLDEEDLAVVMRSKHRPRCIIEFISGSIQLLQTEEAKRCVMETKVFSFHEGICACEQLMGIPIPLSYTRLTSRLLVLWHLTLPVILWDDCNWIVVPATFISAACLFCIEEVGVLIEEPFPMLALDEQCEQVLGTIRDTMAIRSSVNERVLSKRKKTHLEEPCPNGRPPPFLERE